MCEIIAEVAMEAEGWSVLMDMEPGGALGKGR